jgi:hypothetical protein
VTRASLRRAAAAALGLVACVAVRYEHIDGRRLP